MLFLVATTAVAVAQAPASRPKPVADPFGGGGGADSTRVPKSTSKDPFGDGSHAGGAEDPFGSGKPPVIISSIDIGETKLETMLDFVKEKLRENGEVPPNYVFRNGAEEQVIPTLRLRNVSLKGLYGVLVEVAELDIDSLGNPGGEEIIVIRGPNRPSSSRTVRATPSRSGSMMAPTPNPGSLRAGAFRELQPANVPVTKVFATSDLGVDEDDLMSTIRAVWDTSDPDWDKGERAAKLLYHPGTRMLVVKASRERLGDVEQIMAQLSQVKERIQKGEAVEMRRQLQELERSTDRTIRQMEENHDRTVDEMDKDRSRMMEKISVLELALRKAELQQIRGSEAEKAGKGGH